MQMHLRYRLDFISDILTSPRWKPIVRLRIHTIFVFGKTAFCNTNHFKEEVDVSVMWNPAKYVEAFISRAQETEPSKPEDATAHPILSLYV